MHSLSKNVKCNSESDKCDHYSDCIPTRNELEILAKVNMEIDNEATWLLEGQQMKESPLVCYGLGETP